MASGFFAVLDDITVLMDDVAVATKLAARKTAGILGDDLAVNAEKATGFMASRELPVLWAITKGSLLNKLIIVPVALLLNAFLPALISYILLLGGCYLAYEGAEKIVHFLLHRKKTGHEVIETTAKEGPDAEKVKIRSAVTTDFILSVEIVIIALGSVAAESTAIQIITVAAIALLATVGVYGLVALLVRMDDGGLRLIQTSDDKGMIALLGHGMVKALPILIRVLAVVGTIALLLVSGGIFAHNVPALHHIMLTLPAILRELIFGLGIGLVIVALVGVIKKLFQNKNKGQAL